jgi:flagellar basal-body rod protein FlgF/flagellar basal-body rod protein FlgG
MPYGLYISAEGAQAQSRRLEVIANNLANVDTVGFKRQLAMFQARYAEAVDQGKASPGSGSINDLGGGVKVVGTATDFANGPLKKTGMPTDVALRRDGFFEVRRGDETLLTRAGNFQMSPRGELVTQQGYSVLNDAGTPITIERPEAPWQITAAGDVQQQGGAVQRIAIVQPAAPESLVRVGENLFRAETSAPAAAPENRDVAQGYVEMSGVSPTSEMVEMLETTRAVEANLNMMQTQNQMLSGVVDRLMKV